MSEAITEEEYRQHYGEAVPPPMEPCPGCGGLLGYHGHFERDLSADAGTVEPLVLHRGICRNPICPVVTVTHYPPFVTPYSVFPTAVREDAVLRSALGETLEAVATGIGCSVRTVLRWRQMILKRVPELVSGLTGLIVRLDPLWSLPTVRWETILFALSLCTEARELVYAGEGIALLAVPRLRPEWPSALPVFT